jgi:hypothetical protein
MSNQVIAHIWTFGNSGVHWLPGLLRALNRRASQARSARRPITVRDGCGPGLIAAVRQIAMAAHNAASALVAGEVLQRIRVYQEPCKALQRLVTKDHMRTPQVRQSNANDRLRNTGRGHVLPRYRPAGPAAAVRRAWKLRAPFRSRRNGRAGGERLVRVGEGVQRGADLGGGYPCPAANRPTVLPATQRERHGKTPKPLTVTDPCRLGSPEICIGRGVAARRSSSSVVPSLPRHRPHLAMATDLAARHGRTQRAPGAGRQAPRRRRGADRPVWTAHRASQFGGRPVVQGRCPATRFRHGHLSGPAVGQHGHHLLAGQGLFRLPGNLDNAWIHTRHEVRDKLARAIVESGPHASAGVPR